MLKVNTKQELISKGLGIEAGRATELLEVARKVFDESEKVLEMMGKLAIEVKDEQELVWVMYSLGAIMAKHKMVAKMLG